MRIIISILAWPYAPPHSKNYDTISLKIKVSSNEYKKIVIIFLFYLVCNCHNHSNVCYYNDTIAKRNESLNIDYKYSGGGVCLNCQVITVDCST